jgi:hypothetical protein
MDCDLDISENMDMMGQMEDLREREEKEEEEEEEEEKEEEKEEKEERGGIITHEMAEELEMKLGNMTDYLEIDQLAMLIQEVKYICHYEMSPPDDWFETRVDKLFIYHKLEWKSMAQRFYFKDMALHVQCVNIIQGLESLLGSYEMVGHFHLGEYLHTLEVIQKTWNFYEAKYVGGETDYSIVDITESMMYL